MAKEKQQIDPNSQGGIIKELMSAAKPTAAERAARPERIRENDGITPKELRHRLEIPDEQAEVVQAWLNNDKAVGKAYVDALPEALGATGNNATRLRGAIEELRESKKAEEAKAAEAAAGLQQFLEGQAAGREAARRAAREARGNGRSA